MLQDEIATLQGSVGASGATAILNVGIGNNWRAPTALITNLAGAVSGSGSTAIAALITGTLATAGDTLRAGVVTTPSSITYSARSNGINMPWNYRPGTDAVLRLVITETVAAGTAATVNVTGVDAASPATGIITGGAVTMIGASSTNFDFTITGTNLVAGSNLDVVIALFVNGAGTNVQYDISKIQLRYTTA